MRKQMRNVSFTIFKVLTLSLVFMTPVTVMAQDTWQFVSNEGGVQVSKKSVPGSDFVAFRGVKVMPVNLYKIAEVILDDNLETKKKTVDGLVQFKVLEKDGLRAVTYSAYDMPWPIEDRDFVVQSLIKPNTNQDEVVIDLRSIQHSDSPATVGIRAEVTKSMYKLVPLADGKTEVTVEIMTDPKGLIPKWLVNSIQKTWPLKTLSQIEKHAQKPDTKENELLKSHFKSAKFASQTLGK